MIRDVDELTPGEVLHAEFAIAGAGFAGIDLARYLGRNGATVILLESGREEFDPKIQDLTRFECVGKEFRKPDPALLPHLPVHLRGEIMVRQFGGTSAAWSGKWRSFDAFDFERKPWVPDSGWPISRHDIEPFYREIAADYGLEEFDAFADSEPMQEAKRRLAGSGLRISFHYWQKQVMRPAATFRRDLQECCEVILGATVVEILLADDRETVTALIAQSLDGRRFRITADHFILAAGGFATPHLLLASNRQIAEGIGNRSGLVGRYFMDHPKFKRGRLYPGPAMKHLSEWTRKQPRPRFHISLSLSEKVQAEHRLLDHAFHLSPVYAYQVDYPKEMVDRLKQGWRSAAAGQFASAVAGLLSSPRSVWKVIQKTVFRDAAGPVAWYAVQFYVEQAPNPDSRVFLGSGKDALGMPRLAVDWRLNRQDHESFAAMIDLFTRACAESGLGRLEFGPEPFTLHQSTDGAHHMGATRMAATPDRGVVDPNCRVFGTSNLYIASSSVFPTGHSAAPTLTIVALARRLGKHLIALRSAELSQSGDGAAGNASVAAG